MAIKEAIFGDATEYMLDQLQKTVIWYRPNKVGTIVGSMPIMDSKR